MGVGVFGAAGAVLILERSDDQIARERVSRRRLGDSELSRQAQINRFRFRRMSCYLPTSGVVIFGPDSVRRIELRCHSDASRCPRYLACHELQVDQHAGGPFQQMTMSTTGST